MADRARAAGVKGTKTIPGFVVGVVLALSMAPAAAANVRYAAPGGGGPEPCAQASPCTLPDAVNGHSPSDVGDGDQVIVTPGTYHPGPVLDVEDAMDVGGEPGQPVPTIIRNARIFQDLNPGADLHDLVLDDTAPSFSGSALLMGTGSTAERLYVTAANDRACDVGSGLLRDSVCWTRSDTSGVFSSLGGGGSSQLRLRNVTAVGTTAGLEVTATGGSHVSVDAVNVIARGSGGVNPDVLAETDTSMGSAATVSLSHSDYTTARSLNAGSVSSPGTNASITAPPLFANPAGGDFHELAGSPTIDAGLAAPDIGSFDLDGNPRVAAVCLGGATAGNPDIGAYEFPTASPPAAACSVFEIGALSRHKKKGTGSLSVAVPGSGLLAASGKGLKATSASSTAAGNLTLNLRASGKARKRLAHAGKAKLQVTLSWTPTGGVAATQTDKVKLVRK